MFLTSFWSRNGEKVHFLRKSALFRKMGLRGPQKRAYVFRFWSPGARRAHFGEKVHFFALFAPLGRGQLRLTVFGPERPPLRRTTAGWGGVHPPPWTLPQPPHAQTHTSVGVRPELIPFGAALRLLIPLTPTKTAARTSLKSCAKTYVIKVLQIGFCRPQNLSVGP